MLLHTHAIMYIHANSRTDTLLSTHPQPDDLYSKGHAGFNAAPLALSFCRQEASGHLEIVPGEIKLFPGVFRDFLGSPLTAL